MGKRTSPEYYIGLDIGADAVGYAVTSPRYDLLKFKGEPMWGVSLFGEADTSEERRMFRRPVFVGGKACDFLEQTGEVLRIRCGNFGRYIYHRFDCSAASVGFGMDM